jgi:hypothetical protein
MNRFPKPIRPRTQFLRTLLSEIQAFRIPLDQRVLIVGGGWEDEQLLRQAGLTQIVNSNLLTVMARLSPERCGVSAEQAGPSAKHVALDAEVWIFPPTLTTWFSRPKSSITAVRRTAPSAKCSASPAGSSSSWSRMILSS